MSCTLLHEISWFEFQVDFEIVLKLKLISYHVYEFAGVGYASFANVINLVVFGWDLSLGTEPNICFSNYLLQLVIASPQSDENQEAANYESVTSLKRQNTSQHQVVNKKNY